jgi:hypothetical protein
MKERATRRRFLAGSAVLGLAGCGAEKPSHGGRGGS